MRTNVRKNLLLVFLSIFVVLGCLAIGFSHVSTANAATDITITDVVYAPKDNEMYVFRIKTSSAPSSSEWAAYSDENGTSNVPDNILINGKSVRQWNAEYRSTAASWTFNKFPMNSDGFYKKMPIALRSSNGNGAIEIYIHENMYIALVEQFSNMDIQVTSDILTKDNYTLAADSTIYYVKNRVNSSGVNVPNDRDGTMVIPITDASVTEIDADDIRISRWQYASNVYYFDVYCEGLLDTSHNTYAIMDGSYKEKARFVRINGETAYAINQNTDVSGYENWTTHPYTLGATYQKPFLFMNDKTNLKTEIRIKDEWWNANKVNNSLEVSFVPHSYITTASGVYVLLEEVKFMRDSAVLESVTSAAGWIDLRENAAMDTTVSNANRPYSSTEKTWYFNVYFQGFKTLGYDAVNVAAVNDYIELNGKTITELNSEYATAAAGWTWAKFPQNAASKYAKPVLNYVGKDGVMQLQIHENLISALKATYGLVDITVLEGFTFGGYTVSYDCKYVLNGSNSIVSFNDTTVHSVSKSSIAVNMWQIENDLYNIRIDFPGFDSSLGYDIMKSNNAAYYMSNLVHINGVSAKEINETTDVSEYSAWQVFPQNSVASANDIYRKPFLFYTGSNDSVTIKIKKDWWDNNKFANSMEVSVVPGIYITNSSGDIYVAEEEVTFIRDGSRLESSSTLSDKGWIEKSTLTEVGASDVTLFVENNATRPFSSTENTWFFCVNFAGFSTTNNYYEYNKTTNITDYIEINGKSITYLNQNTVVTGWEFNKSPQSGNADSGLYYHKPIVLYVGGTSGKLQIQMHENMYFQELEGIRIKVLKGLNMGGYILTEDKELIFREDTKTFIAESRITYIYPDEISVSRWQPLKDVIYFDINYPAFQSGTDYKMMYESAYCHLANLIRINGKSMYQWNLRTDVSEYSEWQTFPSTGEAAYKKPFVTLISAGKMEVRMKKDWYDANKDENGQITISVVPGTFISADDKLYGVNKTIEFTSDPDNSGYTTEGWVNEHGRIVKGGAIRISSTDSGLRFMAIVEESFINELIERGATIKYGIQLQRAGSSKIVDKECTNKYVEDGIIHYNAVITGIKSYDTDYTAAAYIQATYPGDVTTTIYLGSVTRNVDFVATAAINDCKDVSDDEYKYPFTINGSNKYSRYSPSARAIIMGYSLSISENRDGELYSYSKKSDGNFLMSSSNSDLDEFLDDYAERYLYLDSDEYMTKSAVGECSMTWKEWEATAISHMKSDRTSTNDMRNAVKVAGAVVDKYGYVWEGSENGYFGQGWNLPDYTGRADTSSPFQLDGWEFLNRHKNSSILDVDPKAGGDWGACSNNWTISCDGEFGTDINNQKSDGSPVRGLYYAHATTTASYMTFSVSDNSYNGVFVASAVKFVEICLDWHKGDDEDEYTGIDFIFKNGSNVTKTLNLSTWATTSFDMSAIDGSVHLFIPVYENSYWTGNIKSISIRINGSFTGFIWLDYVRGCFDGRMADTNAAYINAGRSHFETTGDVSFLRKNLQKYRRAMQFLISYMTGSNGLIDLSKLQGHNGGQGYANSLISTYWDILSLAPNSSYVNALYYKALLDMAYIEDAVTANNVSVDSVSVVSKLSGGTTTTYEETATTLRTKAAAVKAAVTANLNTGTKTGYFKNLTSTKGYFVDGYAGSNLIDFQSVAFNLMIIDTGIATDEQAEKIINWMLSESSLYDYVFAPRTNLTNIGNQKVWAHSSVSYDNSVQNGGAILFVSYYDLLARIKVLGADNAYARLQAIMDWYDDVKTAYEASGDDPEDFYKEYYKTHSGTLQGNDTSGSLGLHAEFVENAILLSVVADGFIGLDSHYDGDYAVLDINPQIPSALSYWEMQDVRYLGVDFDVYATDNFVIISDVNNLVNGAKNKAKVSVTLHYSGDTPTVYLNNRVINSGYTVDTENKTITYTSSSFTEFVIGVK